MDVQHVSMRNNYCVHQLTKCLSAIERKLCKHHVHLHFAVSYAGKERAFLKPLRRETKSSQKPAGGSLVDHPTERRDVINQTLGEPERKFLLGILHGV